VHYPGPAPLYPPSERYIEAFGEAQLRHWLARRNIGGIVVPLFFCVQNPSDKYTPGAPAARSSPVRKTLVPDEYLAKERRLVVALLPERDTPALQPAGEPKGDVIGLGPGAFGRIGPVCYQNHARLDDYRAALDRDRLPVWRGIELSADDLVRRSVMEALVRHGRVSMEAVEIGYVIDFRRYFAIELAALAGLEREGLLVLEGDWIVMTTAGRGPLARVCEVFDRYRRLRREQASLSRVI
jgi:hypothetical protein